MVWKRTIFALILVLCVVSTLWAAPKPKRLKLTVLRPLSFGYLVAGQAALTVDPLDPPAGTYPGQISVLGDPWMSFQLVLPTSVELQNVSLSFSIPVTDFQTDLPNDQGTLDGLGECVFQIGATIGPIPLTASGDTYSGSGVISIYYLY